MPRRTFLIVNARVGRYAPKYKYLTNMKQFSGAEFIADFSNSPFQLVYGFENPNDQISFLN